MPRCHEKECFTSSANRCCRLAILQYRYNDHRHPVVKQDVAAQAIDLVRKRLSISQKVHFHRTKVAASSMLISAFADAGLQAADIWNMSDDEVLRHLANVESPRVKKLGKALLARKLFKPIYRIGYHEKDDSMQSKKLWDKITGIYTKYKEPGTRKAFVDRLERLIGIVKYEDPSRALGTVTFSCPDSAMGVKEFGMLVLQHPKDQVRRLEDSSYPPTKVETKAIHELHYYLWKLEVFIDPEIVPVDYLGPLATKLAGAIEHMIGLKNEIPELANVDNIDPDRWESEELVGAILKSTVPRKSRRRTITS